MLSQVVRARMSGAIADLRRRFWASETIAMTVLALAVGLATGLVAVALSRLLAALSAWLAEGAALAGGQARVYLIVLPAAAAVVAGILHRLGRGDSANYDATDISVAIAARHGRIELAASLSRTIGAVIAIAGGGSAGREGPIVHLGAMLGSRTGLALRLNDRRTVTLLAAGAAAGLAATFNAPLAGVMFAVEVILAGFSIQAFGALVVAAAAGSVVSASLLGQSPAFAVPSYAAAAPWELLLFAGLGAVAAVVAKLISAVFSRVEKWLAAWTESGLVRLAVGGLAVGLLGYLAPDVLGLGFTTIEDALRGNLGFTLALSLALLKVLATSLTIGSGAAGGLIGPLLFVGAAAGAAYGQASHALFPGVEAGGGLYALVGMAAVVAAALRAPMTALLLAFELGRDPRLAPPLLIACGASILCAHLLEPAGLVSRQLKLRGIELRPQRDANVLQTVLVEDAMTPAEGLEHVTPDTDLRRLARLFQETGHHGVVVLDDRGDLYGIVTLADVEQAVERGASTATAADICTRNVVTVYADQTLDDALRHFAALDVGRLPVVARDDRNRLIGILRRSGIVRAYAQALVRTPDDDEQLERAHLQAAVGAELAEMVLAQGDHAAGRRLRDVALPPDCVVVSIHRRGRVVVPRGNVQLAAGDRLIILKVSTGIDVLRSILSNGALPAVSDSVDGAAHSAPEDRDPHV